MKDKEYEYRMAGMLFAQNLVHEQGIEALDTEIKRRGITKMPLTVKPAELKSMWDKVCASLYTNIAATILYSLHDEFGFGNKRLHRLAERYQKQIASVTDMDYMGEHYIRLDDYAVELNQKCGMNLDVNIIAMAQDLYDERNESSMYHTAKIERVIEVLMDAGYFDAADFLKAKLSE